VLDRAIPDETALVAHLEGLLRARVHGVTVQRLDLVDDTTTVDVKYQLASRSDRVSPVEQGAGRMLVTPSGRTSS